jgi:hypothetical protein
VKVRDVQIPAVILEIRAINPSLPGQINLMQFAPEAIKFADSRMIKAPLKSEPYGYFIKLCGIWHRDNNIATNYNIVEELYKKYDISPVEPKLLTKGRSSISVMTSEKSSRFEGETPRKALNREMANQHTAEEYTAISEYHETFRPHEYERQEDGTLRRKGQPLTLEEELALPLDERRKIINKLAADWESPNGSAFRKLVGEKTAWDLYVKMTTRLETGVMESE